MSDKSSFPILQAFGFAMQGIRLRLGRMLLVLAGVSIAIAFTNVLLSTNSMFAALPDQALAKSSGMPAAPIFRWLWVAVSLLICTAGTLNAIVMSVTERITEIGTLKCLGSRNIHVVEIFLFESTLLGLLGGILGSVLGYGAAVLNFIATVGTKYLTSQVAAAAVGNIFWCLLMSVVLSLLASIIPVIIAARVEPAAAMRYQV